MNCFMDAPVTKVTESKHTNSQIYKYMIELFFMNLQKALACLIMALRLITEYKHVASWPPRQSCVRQCLQPKEDFKMPTSCDMWLLFSAHLQTYHVVP